MKSAVLLVLLALSSASALAGDPGINFRSGSYAEVLEQAKAGGKPVFLYFHFDGCGACAHMEDSVFIEQHVAELFNETFVCFDINTRKGEGIETNKLYNVEMHPTFLFLDSEGSLLHTAVGVFSPEDFISQARTALDPERRLSTFTKRYESGERDPGFLYDYCYKLRDAYSLKTKHISEYIKTQSDTELKEERNIRFIYEFAMHGYEIAMPLGSKAYQSMLENRELYAKYFDAEQVKSRLVWIAHRAAYLAIEFRKDELFERAISVLTQFDTGKEIWFKEMDGRPTGVMNAHPLVLSLRMEYFAKKGDSVRYEETAKLFLEKVWDDSNNLNDLAWRYYERYADARHLNEALVWAERSLQLGRHYNNLDTYAALLYKLGRYDEALKHANAAIVQAKKYDIDYEGTTELIGKIRDAMK